MTTRLPLLLLLLLCPALAQAQLSIVEKRIVAAVEAQGDEFVRELEAAVNLDSVTENLAGVRALGERHAAQLREIGFDARFIELPPETGRAGHLMAERDGHHGKRVLLIGHLDTVLPGGNFRREGETVHGSGANDMKGGNLVIIQALRALHAAGALDDTRIIVAFTGDEEEPGNPISISRRDLIAAGRRSDVALGFETAIARTATVARRGIMTWELEVQGATGHSSGLWNQALGSGAVYEASRILHEFQTALRALEGVTCNPALIAGGTEVALDRTGGTVTGKSNIVAQRVLARGDLRFLSAEQRAQAQALMQEIVARSLPRTSAELRFINEGFPAMEPLPGNFVLLAELDQVSRDLGYGSITAYDPKARGAGDISFVSPPLPGLDGLGVHGRGAHTPGESMDLSTVPELVRRTALLIHRLTRESGE
jgi:glutamate carboxypeptidase